MVAEKPTKKKRKGHLGVQLHFLGLLVDEWLEDCRLPLLTGRQRQLVKRVMVQASKDASCPPTDLRDGEDGAALMYLGGE